MPSNVDPNHTEEFTSYFLEEQAETAKERALELLESGLSPIEFFQQVFTPAMESVGELFSRLEIYLPELMTAAKTAQTVSEEVVKPAILAEQGEASLKKGTIVLGSVKGDVHTIGKNMVALMLEVNGFEVMDLGVDVASKEFIDRALEAEADIVGLSSLMTTSMPYMKEVVAQRDGLGYSDRFAVIVGGAPITEEYCKQIGAEAYGQNAVDAVKQCQRLIAARTQAASEGTP